jgi:hypothetical protein
MCVYRVFNCDLMFCVAVTNGLGNGLGNEFPFCQST